MRRAIRSIRLLAGFELANAVRNRWFVFFSVLFAAVAIGLVWATLPDPRAYGAAGFGRLTVSLMGLLSLTVPLVGIILGAISIAGDRERGSLAYLLSQPIGHAEAVAGKFAGLGAALAGAVLIATGAGGLAAVLRGVSVSATGYLAIAGLAVALALAGVSLGLLISAGLRKTGVAVAAGLMVWFALAFLSDLGLIGSSLLLRVDVHQLFVLAVANPLQAFKMATLLAARGDLGALGPAGIYAVQTYGRALLPALSAVLVAWVLLPLLGAGLLARRIGAI